MYKVIDLNGKERNIKEATTIKHMVPDIMGGADVPQPFVKVLIAGKNREWVEWWPLKDFEDANPDFYQHLVTSG